MKRNPSANEYPNLNESDVLCDGRVCIWRNPADECFGGEDVFQTRVTWKTTAGIPSAYTRAAEKVEKIGRQTRFAWSPEFGYLSPIPQHCGTGILIHAEFHLEALHLIGELPPVLNAMTGLRMLCEAAVNEDGISQAGHVFEICNASELGLSEQTLVNRVQTVFASLVSQELNARHRLITDYPRLFEDAVTRSIAVLRSARLLSPWEFLDLLSPLRVAATMGFLENMSADSLTDYMVMQLNREPDEDPKTPEEDRRRDARDAKFADNVNRLFTEVRLNKRAREILT